MQAEEANAYRYTGGGYAWRMTAAGNVTVTNHPVRANNQEYVILGVRHQVVNDYTQHAAKTPYRNAFSLLPQKIAYRPRRITPKPLIQGTQSAIVVGPKGEQIYTNGSCVKLHFLWDRRGKLDGTDSMWIRISQPWAGDGWGAAAIPRIGQEVLVAFTQKDMNTVIEDSETHQVVAGSRSVTVAAGDETKQIGKGNLTETIAQKRSTTAADVQVFTPAGDAGGGTQVYGADKSITLAVGDGTIVLTPDGILLKHGSSTIMLSDAGVSVNGQRIDLNK